MKYIPAALVMMLAFAAPALGQSQEYNGTFPPRSRGAQATDRLIVKWRSTVSENAANARARSVGQRKGISLQRKGSIGERLEVLQLEGTLGAAELAAVVEELRTDPDIEFVTPDLRRHLHAVPSDPLFLEQWYLLGAQPAAIRSEQAWDTTTGSDSIVVAIVDTGVRFEHPDLGRVAEGGKILPGYDFVSVPRVSNDGDGWDADASDPGDWVDAADLQQPGLSDCEIGASSWHGTRIAGMIGARTDNVAGIAGGGWSTRILPVRAMGKCGGFDSDIIAAMRWAAGFSVSGTPPNPTPAKIVNLSLGSEGACTPAYQSVVSDLAASGVLVVVSAGNDGGPVGAPANCPGALAVAAIRHVGTKVGFSNLGNEVGLSAPGGNCVNTSGGPCLFSLITTTNLGSTTPQGSEYTDRTLRINVGTSFSAPLVASAAALMYSVNSQLAPPQVITLLKETAAPFPISNDAAVPFCHVPASPADTQLECSCTTQTCGAGMLNAQGAVLAAQRPLAVATAPTTLNVGANAPINGSASVASNNRSIVSYQWSVLAVSGAAPSIVDPTTANTSISVAGNSQFTLRLTVTDDRGSQDVEDVSISTPSPPNVAPSAPPASKSGGGGGGGVLSLPLVSALLFLAWLSALRRRARG
jgi:serine protease